MAGPGGVLTEGPGDIVSMPMPPGSAASNFIDLHAGPEPFPDEKEPSAEEIEQMRPGDIVSMPMPPGFTASDFIDLHAGPDPFPDEEPSAEEIERIRLRQMELEQALVREMRDKGQSFKSEALRLVRSIVPQGSMEEVRRKLQEDELRNQERFDRRREAEKRILGEDPKQGGVYYTRFRYKDLSKFDLDEESSREPMRFTDKVYTGKSDNYGLCEAVNIFSIKIASDVGFPIHVYGTVLARDSLDYKCVYLFRRDRDHCQMINSKDESLILTGPKRALALISPTHVETNLMIKGHQGQEDREFSKGVMEIWGIERRALKKCELESVSLATRLSTVDVKYAVMKRAVEATVAIKVVQGGFYGQIYACTSTIRNGLLLHNSRLARVDTGFGNSKMAGVIEGYDGSDAIQLLQSVVSVHLREKLVVAFFPERSGDCPDDSGSTTNDGRSCILFDPQRNGCSEQEFHVGLSTMRVKVVWSIIE